MRQSIRKCQQRLRKYERVHGRHQYQHWYTHQYYERIAKHTITQIQWGKKRPAPRSCISSAERRPVVARALDFVLPAAPNFYRVWSPSRGGVPGVRSQKYQQYYKYEQHKQYQWYWQHYEHQQHSQYCQHCCATTCATSTTSATRATCASSLACCRQLLVHGEG